MGWTPDQPLIRMRDVHKSFGDVRVLNGIYLANYKLRRTRAAMEAFGKVVDYGSGLIDRFLGPDPKAAGAGAPGAPAVPTAPGSLAPR